MRASFNKSSEDSDGELTQEAKGLHERPHVPASRQKDSAGCIIHRKGPNCDLGTKESDNQDVLHVLLRENQNFARA